jgi:uncharacterized iron-regulated membrane protein
MNLMILFMLASIGMTNIIVESYIFSGIRDFVKKWFPEKISRVLDCHTCSGFWCGIICGIFCFWPNISVLQIFCCGCAASFLASFFYYLTSLIEAKSVVYMPPTDEEIKEDGQ